MTNPKSIYRTFIAVEPSPEVKAALGAIQRSLRNAFSDARWTRPEGLHLTLKFLGDTPVEQIPAITEAICAAAKGESAFDVRLTGLGAFPTPGRARVMWVGAKEGSEAMKRLAARVDDAVSALGFPRETRAFEPHFTLARFRGPAVVSPEALAKNIDASFRAAEVILYRSELLPKGARYTPLGRAALADTGPA